jgi:hypothetical protein
MLTPLACAISSGDVGRQLFHIQKGDVRGDCQKLVEHGNTVKIGSALLQISGSILPCDKQEGVNDIESNVKNPG